MSSSTMNSVGDSFTGAPGDMGRFTEVSGLLAYYEVSFKGGYRVFPWYAGRQSSFMCGLFTIVYKQFSSQVHLCQTKLR